MRSRELLKIAAVSVSLLALLGGFLLFSGYLKKNLPSEKLAGNVENEQGSQVFLNENKKTIYSSLNNSDGEAKNEIEKIEEEKEEKERDETASKNEDNSKEKKKEEINLVEENNQALFVFALGDLVSSCDGKNECKKKLEKWKSALGTLFSKTYVTMGNHDRTGGEKADKLFREFFSFPTNGPEDYKELVYSFNYKNSHFVILNSENPDEHVINEKQRNWLEKDLAANSDKEIFVFFHQPAYPVSSKIGESLDAKPQERDKLWNILAKYKVKAVFCGHEHIVSRRQVKGVYQFVFGNTQSFHHELPRAGVAEYSHRGESFGLVEVYPDKVTVKTYTVNGALLNTFSF